jgi:hypothetical protein
VQIWASGRHLRTTVRNVLAGPRAGRVTCAIAFAFALLVSARADGHPRVTATAAAEQELVREETIALGPAHAAEHAAQRRALRRAAATAPAPSRAKLRLAAPEEPADEVGRWEPRTIDLPTYAINAAVLPTGRIAFWGRPPLNEDGTRDNTSEFWVLDPAEGASEPLIERPAPLIDMDGDGDLDQPAPLFCSGQSLLASGELFVAGGNLGNPSYLGGSTPQWRGLDRAFTFDPWTLAWTEQLDRPRHGRWYPSQVELPDGRIAILAGFDEDGQGTTNIELEVFTPAAARGGQGTMTRYANADRATAFYPHMFTLPSGRIALGGPGKGDSAVLDPALLGDAGTPPPWTDLSPTKVDRVGGNAVLSPGTSRVDLIGGYYYSAGGGTALTDSESRDFAQPGDWTINGNVPALNVSRSYGNVVQLPDGGLVAVGGGAGDNGSAGDGVNWTAGSQDRKRVELLGPAQTAWRLGPPQRKWRAYHSIALLLPDGRVLSAGDDYWGLGDTPRPEGGDPLDVAEIYSPPYLFDGDGPAARPVIDSAPAAVGYGDAFRVAVTGREAVRAVLVAPSATTHGADMNQRVVPLELRGAVPGEGIDVTAPADAALAPPGYYMLFVLDADGTPSVAKFVRLGAGPPPAGAHGPGPGPEPTVTPVLTSTPTPAAAPAPPPATVADRRAPRVRATVHRAGRHRVRLALSLDEPGRLRVDARISRRTQHRALRFRAAATRRIRLAVPRRGGRLHLRLTVTDAAGNRRTVTRGWRVRSAPG